MKVAETGGKKTGIKISIPQTTFLSYWSDNGKKLGKTGYSAFPKPPFQFFFFPAFRWCFCKIYSTSERI